MSETLLAWVGLYGPPALFLATALGCFGVPLPSSLALLAGGALIASGDVGAASAILAAFAGATLGDQAGYALGRLGGTSALGRLRTASALAPAEALFRRRGGLGIFLSRWLVAPLGPPMNVVAGLLPMNWRLFTVFGSLGEAIWVGGYIAIGWAFSGSILALASALDDLGWFLAGALATVTLAVLLWRRIARGRKAAPDDRRRENCRGD